MYIMNGNTFTLTYKNSWWKLNQQIKKLIIELSPHSFSGGADRKAEKEKKTLTSKKNFQQKK